MSDLRRSLAVPGFRALLGSYVINRAGDVVGALALAVVVLATTGSTLATAVLFLATQFLPGLVGPAIAARVDRVAPGRLLCALYLAEALLFGVLAGLVSARAGAVLIVGVAFLDAMLAFVARALTRSAIGSLLARAGLLPEGKAAVNVALAAAMIAGPVLAGVTLAALGSAVALGVDAGSFLLAGLVLVRVPSLRAAPEALGPPARARFREGLRYLAGQPVLRALILGEGAAFVFFYLVVPVTVVYSARTLHAGSGGYAAILTGWGAGIAIGSAIQLRMARRVGQTMILLSTGAVAAGYLGTAVAPTIAVAVAVSVIGGIGNGTQWASVETAIHQLVAEEFRARAAAVLEALAAIAPGAGIVLGGVLTAMLSPRAAYAAAGLGLLVLIAGARAAGVSMPDASVPAPPQSVSAAAARSMPAAAARPVPAAAAQSVPAAAPARAA